MISHAQAGQDEWVQSIIGDSGYFVDVGAHDGIVHSNTYALEQLGWTGICIEPDPTPCAELLMNRYCQVLPAAISDHDGRVLVMPSGVDSPCFTLTNALVAVEAPPVIDYLSIDVEGHELEVLDGMDFDRWHVRLITIEHNLYCDGSERQELIYERLTSNGFKIVREDVVAPGYGPYEDWYANAQP